MRHYKVAMWAIHGQGEDYLGTADVSARNKAAAIRAARDLLWDDRLDAADCRPVYDVVFIPKAAWDAQEVS